MEYKLNDHTQLRAGYFFYESPVPEHTFDPSIPGADRHGITLGLGRQWDSVTVDLAYSAIFVDDRHITNMVGATSGTSINGKYESFIHLVALTFTYKF
jgi:long-chain fatty acid transport protein